MIFYVNVAIAVINIVMGCANKTHWLTVARRGLWHMKTFQHQYFQTCNSPKSNSKQVSRNGTTMLSQSKNWMKQGFPLKRMPKHQVWKSEFCLKTRVLIPWINQSGFATAPLYSLQATALHPKNEYLLPVPGIQKQNAGYTTSLLQSSREHIVHRRTSLEAKSCSEAVIEG